MRGERLLLKVGRQTRRGGERGELRFQVLQRLLGLGDQRFLARRVATELSDARLKLPVAVGRAACLTLQVVLLDLEAASTAPLAAS